MKYLNDQLIERLASEYVLGTLYGSARTRFQKLRAAHPSIDKKVVYWENNFAVLAAKNPAIQPDIRVWKNIEAILNNKPASAPKNSQYEWIWQLWGALSSAGLVIVLAIYWGIGQPSSQLPSKPDRQIQADSQVAIVGDSNNPEWVISASLTSAVITARAVNAEAASLDRVFELWMLPEDGTPRSLGLLPVHGDRVQNNIPPALLALLGKTTGLAVSIEPAGGSPTGLPTGDVVFTTLLTRL